MADLHLAIAPATRWAPRRLVVLKRVRPEYARQREFLRMFLGEARIASTLRHPHIVEVLDVGVANANYFFTMEYLPGRDLQEVMGAAPLGPMPIEHALHLITAVCSGLHYAHEKVGESGRPLGIVHRDVSPTNVLVTYAGAVKLLDFGLARAGAAATEHAGQVWGKAGYMSPEQCLGETLDRRSDVFSVGVLLYELTTGVPLFSHASDHDAMAQVVYGRVRRPSELAPGFPVALEAILMRALARDRTARYPTAGHLQNALTAFARSAGVEFSPAGLQRYVAGLFGDDVDGWREARASGVTFAEHVATLASVEWEEAKPAARAARTRELPETRRMTVREYPFAAPPHPEHSLTTS